MPAARCVARVLLTIQKLPANFRGIHPYHWDVAKGNTIATGHSICKHLKKKLLAFCNQWLTFLTIRFLKKETGNEKNSKIKKKLSNRRWKIFSIYWIKFNFIHSWLQSQTVKTVEDLKMGLVSHILLLTLVIVGSWSTEDTTVTPKRILSKSCEKPGENFYLLGCKVIRRSFPTSKFDFWIFFISVSFFQ